MNASDLSGPIWSVEARHRVFTTSGLGNAAQGE